MKKLSKNEILSGIVFQLNEYAERLCNDINWFSADNEKYARKQVKEIDNILDNLCDYKLVEKEGL